VALKTFDEIKKIIERRNVPVDLLLGNGFSIGAFPNKFSYQNIFNNSDFTGHETIRSVFERLGTHDFEKAMSYLQLLQKTQGLLTSGDIDFEREISFLKEILIRTISESHPDRPEDLYQPALSA